MTGKRQEEGEQQDSTQPLLRPKLDKTKEKDKQSKENASNKERTRTNVHPLPTTTIDTKMPRIRCEPVTSSPPHTPTNPFDSSPGRMHTLSSWIRQDVFGGGVRFVPKSEDDEVDSLVSYAVVAVYFLRVLFVGVVIAFDVFVHHFTTLPLRAAVGSMRLLVSMFARLNRMTAFSQKQTGQARCDFMAGLHLVISVIALFALDDCYIEEFVRSQAVMKLYVGAQIMCTLNGLLSKWSFAMYETYYHCASPVEFGFTFLFVQFYYLLQSVSDFILAVIVVVAIAGGEKGIGSGVSGGLAVIALLIQVDLTNAMKGPFSKASTKDIYKVVVQDCTKVAHWIIIFTLSYCVHMNEEFWGGVGLFLSVLVVMMALKHATILLSHQHRADLHISSVLPRLCVSYLIRRDRTFHKHFATISIGTAATTVRLCAGAIGSHFLTKCSGFSWSALKTWLTELYTGQSFPSDYCPAQEDIFAAKVLSSQKQCVVAHSYFQSKTVIGSVAIELTLLWGMKVLTACFLFYSCNQVAQRAPKALICIDSPDNCKASEETEEEEEPSTLPTINRIRSFSDWEDTVLNTPRGYMSFGSPILSQTTPSHHRTRQKPNGNTLIFDPALSPGSSPFNSPTSVSTASSLQTSPRIEPEQEDPCPLLPVVGQKNHKKTLDENGVPYPVLSTPLNKIGVQDK